MELLEGQSVSLKTATLTFNIKTEVSPRLYWKKRSVVILEGRFGEMEGEEMI